MKIGQAKVDFDAHQITGLSGRQSVEPKVMQVLSVLVDQAGTVVTREELIDQVWGVGFGGEGRLSRAISLLRKALDDNDPHHRYIQTIPKRGYILNLHEDAPTLAVPSAEDASSDKIAEFSVKHKPKPKVLFALCSLAVALTAIAFFLFNSDRFRSTHESPLVMIMDSAHPARIYDDSVKADGGTNADILSDILSDLPLRTQKELISPNWHRYEAIIQFDPDLILVHYSGFKQEDASGDRPKLRLLVEYFQNTDTDFLIYSRANSEWLDGNMDIILEDLYANNPALKDRINIYPLLEYGSPNWMDQGSAQGVKLKIKTILELN